MKQSNGWNNARYATEIDGYSIMVQLMNTCNPNGIAGGRISKMLVYPLRTVNDTQKIVVYDLAWKEGVPDNKEIRKVVEQAVQFFDQVDIDWEGEKSRELAFAHIG